jgi:lipopolysaccharide export system permease protein
MLRQMVFNDAEELLYSMLKRHGDINQVQFPYAMWVKGVQGRKLIAPVIKHRNAQGKPDLVISAKEAELQVDMARRQLLIRMRYGSVWTPEGSNGQFDEKTQTIDLPPTFGPESRRRERDMTWGEMLVRRRQMRQQADKDREQIAELAPAAAQPDAPPELAKHLQELLTDEQFCRQQSVYLDVELQMRPALSAGCLCFILVGCPVGIWFSRSDFLSSFMTCFLPVVLLYYPLMLCGTGLAKDGRYDVVSLVWGADGLMAAVGVVLFWRLLRK